MALEFPTYYESTTQSNTISYDLQELVIRILRGTKVIVYDNSRQLRSNRKHTSMVAEAVSGDNISTSLAADKHPEKNIFWKSRIIAVVKLHQCRKHGRLFVYWFKSAQVEALCGTFSN
jgi:hypothetical protein